MYNFSTVQVLLMLDTVLIVVHFLFESVLRTDSIFIILSILFFDGVGRGYFHHITPEFDGIRRLKAEVGTTDTYIVR